MLSLILSSRFPVCVCSGATLQPHSLGVNRCRSIFHGCRCSHGLQETFPVHHWGQWRRWGPDRSSKSALMSVFTLCLIFCVYVCVVCRHPDGHDRPCPGQNPRGNQDVGTGGLHAQFPAPGSLSGQTARAHQWQGQLSPTLPVMRSNNCILPVSVCNSIADFCSKIKRQHWRMYSI